MSVLEWIIQNKESILAIYGAVQIIATTVARLTPTRKDNDWLENARNFLEKLSKLWLPNRKL